ncbi:MAG: aspartate/glutamate racemase family protein [Roseibium sp.]
MTVALINPNTSETTTASMVRIAAAAVPGLRFSGVTAPFGPSIISNDAELATAAEAVRTLDLSGVAGLEGVVVAAFGDPGLEELKHRAGVPVVGIGESGMLEAAGGGRRFSIVTTTPGLVASIRRRASAVGVHAELASVRLTEGDFRETMATQGVLAERLRKAIEAAVSRDGAEAVLIGGGPLASAARALESRVDVPVIEPVGAAARCLGAMLGQPVPERP